MSARLRVVVPSAVLAALLVGCGASSTPADDVPRLADQLEAVDRALVDEDYARAGDRLRALLATAQRARTEGTLEDGEADRVLAAAGQLLAELPTPAAEPAPVEQAPEEDAGQGGEAQPPAEPDEQAQEEERKEAEERKKAEEERKEAEEERKEAEEERKEAREERKEDQEGGGNGDSSGKGKDDSGGD